MDMKAKADRDRDRDKDRGTIPEIILKPGTKLNHDQYYQALLSRDERFDGLFYVGVSSTGIYCRPVCRVKPALQKNCTFYSSAAAAEQAGYRPCLKCRPELAPGYALHESVSRLAALAYQFIEEGFLNQGSVAELAEELAVSERHLRRAIRQQFGVSAVQIAQSQRLLLAKRLLTDTDLDLSELAYASGFRSLRRFNSLFKERYALSPGQLRKGRPEEHSRELISRLSYRPPFAWSDLLDFLRQRACAGMELLTENSYQRSVSLDGHKGWIKVSNIDEKNQLEVQISSSLSPVLFSVLGRVKRLFDLNARPELISAQLKSLAAKNPGLRLPGAFDGYEVSLRAILGQQISVKAATTLWSRLSAAYAEKFDSSIPGLERLPLRAEQIALARQEDIAALGISRSRAGYLIAFSRAVAEQKVRLVAGMDISRQIQDLKKIPGIGEWTAQYIAMRAFAWPDAFPHTDLGIIKALQSSNKKEILTMAESWRPWRAYAAMHLWQGLKAETEKESGKKKEKDKKTKGKSQ